MEFVYLAIALVAVVGVLTLLRRAAKKSLTDSQARERLGLDTPPPVRQRRRPRASDLASEPQPDEAKPASREPAPPADAEAAAAYKAGLAKTRGGFVAKIGKLFGKKQIDENVVDELEEVLFTADIGPRAADRIFQSVKKGLSKNDLTDGE